MHIVHIALGGCLTYPNIRYGLTDDTGGHIAYILGAARAQARRADVTRIDIVTRAFDDANLGSDHARLTQRMTDKISILRLATDDPRYLSKEALAADVPALRRAFAQLIDRMERKPEIIHAHFADAASVVRKTAKRHGISTVYTPHSLGIDKAACLSGRPSRALDRRIAQEREALSQSDAIVVSSRDEAERQVTDYGIDIAGRTYRIAPGVTLPETSTGTAKARALIDPLLTDPDKPMILAIARPVAKKNLAALLEAYLDNPALQAKANLVVLAGQRGTGIRQTGETARVLSELDALAARAPGRIALPPRHAQGVVPQVYRLASERRGVFVNPALHEPFGLTLLEAAQAGLPVIATCKGGPVDILDALRNGALVDPADVAGLGPTISDLISDATRWSEMSVSGRRRMRAFDWDTWAATSLRVYAQLRRPMPVHSTPRHLLACDIDGTLTGCRAGTAAFAGWAETRDMPFIVATGRSITEARSVLANWDLPEPDAFVTAVGTELHRPDAGGRLSLCAGFADSLAKDWNRADVLTALKEAGATMQPPVEQRRWKLAAFGNEAEADRLRSYLNGIGLCARVIASHGRLIDILAPHGGKAAAIHFYAQMLGLNDRDCIVAGDSGNDLDMLSGPMRAIVVGNALPDLDRLVAHRGLYRARRKHANGVLEGLDKHLRAESVSA